MPADPSSAEQFSFACAQLGRDASVHIDLPDCLEAMRGLVLDRSSEVSVSYEATVAALCRLSEQHNLRPDAVPNRGQWTSEDCKNYVRKFAQDQNVPIGLAGAECCDEQFELQAWFPGTNYVTPGVMLSEKTAYSRAVESFRALMDSTELVGFAEAFMVELLAEEVLLSLREQGVLDSGKSNACRPEEPSLPSKAIAIRG